MRKKLIDSTKADIKKYMMIVESAGKVPASTREDFTLEDIENPYFQGDEDTEESEGNRYYVTVGVKIGYDENTDSYFPELIWDQETGIEIEFDKLDKISKKSIQDKCDTVGAKIHMQRKDVYEEADDEETTAFKNDAKKHGSKWLEPSPDGTERVSKAILDKIIANVSKTEKVETKSYGKMLTEYTASFGIVGFEMHNIGPNGSKLGTECFSAYKHLANSQISESSQIVVKALMQKFKISESKAKSIVAKVSESLKHPIKESKMYIQNIPKGEVCLVKIQDKFIKSFEFDLDSDDDDAFVTYTSEISNAKKYVVGSRDLTDVLDEFGSDATLVRVSESL